MRDPSNLTFGPEGPEIPGGPCNPRMPLRPWSPWVELQHIMPLRCAAICTMNNIITKYRIPSLLGCQFLVAHQDLLNQVNQARPKKEEINTIWKQYSHK